MPTVTTYNMSDDEIIKQADEIKKRRLQLQKYRTIVDRLICNETHAQDKKEKELYNILENIDTLKELVNKQQKAINELRYDINNDQIIN